jgi:hypothetical protein
MNTLHTLTLFTDDMGSFKQPGCSSVEDALWHVNSARDHDGLPHLTIDDLMALFRGTNKGWAKLTPQS